MKIAAFLGAALFATAALAADMPPPSSNVAEPQAEQNVYRHDQSLNLSLQDFEKAVGDLEIEARKESEQARDTQAKADWIWKNFGEPAYAVKPPPPPR